MKIIIIVLNLAVLALAAPKSSKLSLRSISPRIIGGSLAAPHSIPYQAFLEVYAFQSGYYCGGSLISKNYVLSTNYCTKYDAFEVLVTIGAHNIFHPESTQVNLYSTDIFTNDYLALIKLPKPVEFTDSIQPAVLPTRTDADRSLIGSVARISGWGSATENGQLFDILRVTNMIVADCDEHDTSFQLCASGDIQGNYVGPCHGDNGGPVVINRVLVSVIALELPLDACVPEWQYDSRNSVRLDHFLDWIEENSDVVIN